jgi:hypothetical protein
MAATKTKEAPKEEVEEKEVNAKEEAQKEADKIDEQIEVFEPRLAPVTRTLEHPISNEKKEFVQKELGYLNKLKFFRLLSGTVRAAATDETGISNFLTDTFGDLSTVTEGGGANETIMANEFLQGIMKLIELSPDFVEELYILALGVKPKDRDWVIAALDDLDDETGVDILKLFIEQNGGAVRNFFDRYMKEIATSFQNTVMKNEEEE